jgi:hypothetical protein
VSEGVPSGALCAASAKFLCPLHVHPRADDSTRLRDVQQAIWNLEIAVIGPEQEGQRIIKELKEKAHAEDRPQPRVVWTITYLDLPTVEAALNALERDLDAIDEAIGSTWRDVLRIGTKQG